MCVGSVPSRGSRPAKSTQSTHNPGFTQCPEVVWPKHIRQETWEGMLHPGDAEPVVPLATVPWDGQAGTHTTACEP